MSLFRALRATAFHPLAGCIVALALTAGCGAGSEPVRIGLAGPFTDPVGRPMLLAAELAVEEINASGGIDGRRVELVARDDRGESDSALAVAEELKASDVSAVVGHLYSGQTLAAAPIYNAGDDAVVAISPSSSSPEVTGAGEYTFRVCPSDLAHGAALARWARERLGFERGTVFYLNDQYGRGIRQTFVDEFTGRRGDLRAINPYLGDAPDVGVYLDRLVHDGRSQFILVAGNLTEGEHILREAARREIRLPLMGADGLEGIEDAGAVAEGAYVSLSYLPSLETEANRRFVAAYRSRYPEAGPPSQTAAATYDAIHLLAEVIAQVGPDRRQIRDALAARDASTPYEGVTGRIAFDANGDVPNQQVYIAVVRGGTLQSAEAP